MSIYVILSAIAGGKTRLAEKVVEENDDIKFIDDSLDVVQCIQGENSLDIYYSDLARWSLTIQLLFLYLRVEKAEKTAKHANMIYIMEGDWWSSKMCFGNMLKENKDIQDNEWKLYELIYDRFVKNVLKISGYIFIDCDIDVHMERMRKRGRKGEEKITREFQENLINKHNMMKNVCHKQNIPFIVIDGNKDINDTDVKTSMVKDVIEFVHKK